MKWVGHHGGVGSRVGRGVGGKYRFRPPKCPNRSRCPEASSRTYPDEQGFRNRAIRVINALATNDLGNLAKRILTGGDPGKYLPGASMAKLMIDPDDPEVRHYMNDDRSYKEHYHFAAVNWARFYPLYGKQGPDPGNHRETGRPSQTIRCVPESFGNRKSQNHEYDGCERSFPTWLETGLSGKTKEQTLSIAQTTASRFHQNHLCHRERGMG
ncbi:MAG: hypothetical protein KatS3mg104_2017 [Phycisphaerae bacterium]|nr:MAG: hypothetical protein KatS3mg104_2017 [Phycisphaerae bacterium]